MSLKALAQWLRPGPNEVLYPKDVDDIQEVRGIKLICVTSFDL